MTEGSNNIGVFKAPSDIHFMGYEKTSNSSMPHSSVELMKMSRDGIWVNPDIPVEETAKQVLEILDNALKNMVCIAVEEEREACAYLCDRVAEENRHVDEQAELCAFAIRERGAP
jgi:hypothetical protein